MPPYSPDYNPIEMIRQNQDSTAQGRRA
ncbi:hypothetical protein [Rhizobium leguminosarum]